MKSEVKSMCGQVTRASLNYGRPPNKAFGRVPKRGVEGAARPRAALRLGPTGPYPPAASARREADALWRHVLQMVCREEDVANPGDCWTHVIVDQPVVVVRTESGTLRAFHNVCRHRGNVIKRDRENTTELRCSYHGWRWSLA